jgi:hypothetical protein
VLSEDAVRKEGLKDRRKIKLCVGRNGFRIAASLNRFSNIVFEMGF